MKPIFSKRNVILVLTALLFVAVSACTTTSATKSARIKKVHARVDLGTAYLKSRQHTAALKEFLEAEKITPDDPDIHLYTGIAYFELYINDKAIESFQKAIKYKSDFSEAHNYLGAVYLRTGEYDKAITEFKMTLSDVLYPTPDVCLNNLGWAYYQKGEYRMALAQYRQALQRNTNKYLRFLIYKHMGIAYFALHEYENAVDYFERSLELVPNLQEAHYWLGRSYLKLNDLRKASEALEQAMTLNPDSEYGTRARRYLSVIPDE